MTKPIEEIYRPPESSLTNDVIAESVSAEFILQQLLAEQSYLRVFLFGFIGSVVGVVVLALFLVTPGIFFLAFALPGLITGGAIRLFGKAVDVKLRVFAGIVVLLLYWLLISQLNPSSVWLGFLLSLCNAVVAGGISRRNLTTDQEAAIYFRRMGIEASTSGDK